MSQSFICPNCSAPLDYDGEGATQRCPYCNNSVIVPESLRASQPPPPARDPLVKDPSLLEVAELFREGKRVQATIRYREITGASLTEAHIAIEQYANGQLLTRPNRLQTPPSAPSYPSYQPPPPVFVSTTTTATSRRPARAAGCVGGIAALAIVVVTAVAIMILVGGGGAFMAFNPADVDLGSLVGLGFAERTLSFGKGEGDGPGFFKDTRTIAVDGEGNIYTGDYDTRRIQVFDSAGNFVKQWKLQSKQPYLSGLAATRDGQLYAVVSGEIQRYDAQSGELLDTLDNAGVFGGIDDIALTADGSLVATADDTLLWYSNDGQLERTTQKPLQEILFGADSTESVASVNSIAVDGSGNIYLAIFPQYYIFKLSPEGALVDRIGGEGEGNGKFRTWPDAVAIDGQGRIYVCDFKGIQVFDPSGNYLGNISIEGYTFDMVFNLQNELLVMDRNANKVHKYQVKADG